ncbi:MAG: site-specific integrase [Methanoregula sp.]|jgi:integrase
MSVLDYIEDKNPSRRRTCIAGVRLFLDYIYKGERIKHGHVTTTEEKDLYEALAARYIQDASRDRVQDLIRWHKQSSAAPSTLKAYAGVVKEFLETNGIELTRTQAKKIQKEYSGGIEAPEDAPDHQMIRSYLEHADVRMKAMCLLLSSSGMRKGELLSVRETSIDWDRRMITLKAADTKTKTGRVVFFTKEAEKALNAFLKVRTHYIEESNIKAAKLGEDRQTVDNGNIFPFEPVTMNRAWNRNLKHAGQHETNSRGAVIFHPHSLRQFFSTQMRKNGCPDSIVEILLGHRLYMGTYTRYSPSELQEAYEKYSSALIIGSADDVRRTVNALAEKAEEHNGVIKTLEAEKEALKAQVDDMKRQMEILSTLMTILKDKK